MNKVEVRKAVHDYIARVLGDSRFDEDARLAELGLDVQDIQDLIIHLEDEFRLTAFTHDEDRLLKRAVTARDLTQFLLEIGRS